MTLELVPKEALDDAAGQKTNNEEVPKYIGSERRKMLRRFTVDRREMIRFEGSRPDRRSGNERRIVLQLWDGRST